jgi:hypothetical protein
MPTFVAREPIYLMPDGSVSNDPEGAERQLAGVGHIITEPVQRRYGIRNPDLPAPPEPEAEPGPAAEEPAEEPAPEPPKRAARPAPKRSRR